MYGTHRRLVSSTGLQGGKGESERWERERGRERRGGEKSGKDDTGLLPEGKDM